MLRLLLLTMIGFGLMWGGPTYAAERLAKSGPTSAGYSFTTDLTYNTIYAYPGSQATPQSEAADLYPPRTTLTVAVTDSAGHPVSGVPVAFDVAQNSMLQGMLNITPQQETTGPDGKVQATVEPSSTATTGTGDVLVRVGDTTQSVQLTVDKSPIRRTK